MPEYPFLSPRLAALREHALCTTGRGGFPDRAGADYDTYAEIVERYAAHCRVEIRPEELVVGGGGPVSGAAEVELQQLFARVRKLPFSETLGTLQRRGLVIPCGNHAVIDYRRALDEGLGALRSRLAATARRAAPERKNLYAAWQRIAAAHAHWIRRYAECARRDADRCDAPGRRGELERIANDCDYLADRAPETFRQACQLLCFVYYFAPDSPGRIDQLLIDFYRRDLAAGRISRDDAREVLGCLWIIFFECLGCDHPRGGATHLALGGVTPDGRDAVNEISELICEVAGTLRLIRPQIAIRCQPGLTPRNFLRRAVALLRENFGSPDFCNDAAIVPALEALGIRTADARDYCPSGCHEIIIAGRSHMGALEGEFNLPLLLRCALGLDPRPGGAPAAAEEFADFAGLWRRWREILDELIDAIAHGSYELDQGRAHTSWGLAAALFTDDCIARGLTPAQGGAVYNGCNWDAIGIANLTDALAALKQLVFDQRKVTLAEFRAALAADWQDEYAALRRQIERDVPHFGNDRSEVDAIAADIVRACVESFARHTPYRGGKYNLGTLAGYENAHAVFGECTGATPEGRRAGKAFAASLGPVPGRDRSGVTAMLRSVASLPSACLPTSTTVNINFDMALLSDRDGIDRVAGLIEGYFAAGGIELQPTVIDPALLREAQLRPEEYAGLTVRVAGYSARFTTLAPEVQEEIIARTWNCA